ncbi:MAG: hypothetical protein ACK55V_03305 [Alphaproteobacteria bacterium]
MPRFFGANTAPLGTTPPGLVDGSVQGGRVRVYRERIALAGQTTADTVVLAQPSAGETFLCGTLTSDVSLGTALVAVGTAATPGKYRTAAAHTLTDQPVNFGRVAAQAAKLALDETVQLSISTAALPATGTLVVDLYFSQS